MRPAIVGAHLVFHPDAMGVALAGDPPVAAERDNLVWYERGLPREAGGWTVLPAAAGASQDVIAKEALRLCARWQDALTRSRAMKPPALLAAGPDPVGVALSQALSPARVRPARVRIVADDARMAATLRLAFPEKALNIETDLSGRSLFSEHALEEQIETLLSPVVDLQCGGTIFIEQTAAVVAIDVDAGAADEGGREATALAVNREAADVIARQISLRDLAGHVVIDFVPLRRRDNQRKLLRRLTRAFARHGLAVDLAGFTRLGLVEFTRRRERPSLPDTMLASCPACEGQGRVSSPLTVALKALRDVVAEDRAAPGRAWGIEAAPEVIAVLGAPAMDALRETEARLGRPLKLHTNALRAPDSYKLVAARDKENE
jgi:Rne/Rng family ribonuclease